MKMSPKVEDVIEELVPGDEALHPHYEDEEPPLFTNYWPRHKPRRKLNWNAYNSHAEKTIVLCSALNELMAYAVVNIPAYASFIGDWQIEMIAKYDIDGRIFLSSSIGDTIRECVVVGINGSLIYSREDAIECRVNRIKSEVADLEVQRQLSKANKQREKEFREKELKVIMEYRIRENLCLSCGRLLWQSHSRPNVHDECS